jgi:hypothetical protein
MENLLARTTELLSARIRVMKTSLAARTRFLSVTTHAMGFTPAKDAAALLETISVTEIMRATSERTDLAFVSLGLLSLESQPLVAA